MKRQYGFISTTEQQSAKASGLLTGLFQREATATSHRNDRVHGLYIHRVCHTYSRQCNCFTCRRTFRLGTYQCTSTRSAKAWTYKKCKLTFFDSPLLNAASIMHEHVIRV